jgi:predicted permease
MGRKDRERDLERELRSHLETEAEELRDAGMRHDEARWAARRALGNTTFIQEEVRSVWTFEKLEQIAQDVRYAFRGMAKNPGFAATAILSLALGIGANTAIFTVVNAVLLKPLPFPEPEQLVQVWESRPSRGYFRNVVNAHNFLDWRERSRSFEDMAAVGSTTASVTGAGDPVAVDALMVSPSYFGVLRTGPAIGRVFTAEEGRPSAPDAPSAPGPVILTHAFWQSRFGGDPGVLGRRIFINGGPSTIVGVMPPSFRLPKQRPDLLVPLTISRDSRFGRGRSLSAIGRLKPGVSLQQAADDLHAVAAQYGRERPAFNEGWSAEAYLMLDDAVQGIRVALLVLLAAVGLVLLIACANVANLLLMRGAGRLREISVRAALGAGKGRLLQQLLFESLALAVVACAVGVAAGHLGVKALVATVPRAQLPRLETIQMDGTVVLFAVGLALLTAVIAGLVPYFQVSQVDPHQALQQGSGRTTSRSGVRRTLVVVEVALSLVLLAGAGLMLRSFHRLTSVNPGFQTSRVLTMEMFVSPGRYRDDARRAAYFSRLFEEIRGVPGVREVGSTHFLPLQGRTSGSCFTRAEDGEPVPSRSPGAGFLVVSPGYFQTMQTPLVTGRHFDTRDRVGTLGAVIVNQQFVREHLKGRDPIGQKLNVCWTVENPVEIVGVVADARQTELDAAVRATIFINNFQSPMFFANLVVRTAGDPLQLQRAIQGAVQKIEPDQALGSVQTMDTVFSNSVAQPRLQVVLLTVFAAIAAALAMVGVYGVVAYSAARRVREIGVRMALGASPGDVRKLLLKEGFVLGGVGVAIGVGGALVVTRWMRTLLFETEPTDPATLAVVSGAILMVVFAATVIPANRAARVDPTVALRHE